MLYREVITICSRIHTKHINTLCRQNVEFMGVKLAVYIATIGLTNTSEQLPLCVSASATLISPDVFVTYFSLVCAKERKSHFESRNRFLSLNE